MKTPRFEAEEDLNELARIFASETQCENIKSFFNALLTPSEAAGVSLRWALVKALQKKTPQREIAKKLGVSLCKITRGSRELKKSPAFFKMLSLLNENPAQISK
jgi:TrpR family trp operon transcriptional repressor